MSASTRDSEPRKFIVMTSSSPLLSCDLCGIVVAYLPLFPILSHPTALRAFLMRIFLGGIASEHSMDTVVFNVPLFDVLL